MVIVGIEPMIPGSLTNALTSLLALEETDHNFIHSTKPMQKIKGMLVRQLSKVKWTFRTNSVQLRPGFNKLAQRPVQAL